MNSRKYAILGWLSGLVFWISYFVMSSIRADYFHKYKAVSELGSIGAPNAVFWNVTGFMCVGVFISLFSIGLHKSVSPSGADKGKAAFSFLLGSGLFFIFAGIFPGNFEEKSSLTMILHAVGNLGSGLLFVLAAFSYIPVMRSSAHWRSAVVPSITIVILFILSGFLRSGAAPALGQKIGFAIFFAWISFMAYKLYSSSASRPSLRLTARDTHNVGAGKIYE